MSASCYTQKLGLYQPRTCCNKTRPEYHSRSYIIRILAIDRIRLPVLSEVFIGQYRRDTRNVGTVCSDNDLYAESVTANWPEAELSYGQCNCICQSEDAHENGAYLPCQLDRPALVSLGPEEIEEETRAKDSRNCYTDENVE